MAYIQGMYPLYYEFPYLHRQLFQTSLIHLCELISAGMIYMDANNRPPQRKHGSIGLRF